MIQSCPNLIDHTRFSSPVKENSIPSKEETTCTKVMRAALVVFGVLAACGFTACVAAAVIMGSAPLAIGAAAVALFGIGLLISVPCIFRSKREQFLLQNDSFPRNTPIYNQPVTPNNYVSIVNMNKDQNLRPSVPQSSLAKRPSSGRLQSPIPRLPSHPTVTLNAHVLPGSRDTRDTRDTRQVQVSTRDVRNNHADGRVLVGTR